MRKVSFLLMAAAVAASAISEAQLVGYWDFENPTYPALDQSGFGNDGQLVGNAIRTSDSAVGTGALALDGSGGYLRLYNCTNGELKGNFKYGQATFAVWIKLLSDAVAGGKTGLANLGCYGIPAHYPQPNGTSLSLALFLSYSASQQANPIQVPLPAGIQLDRWHHLAVTVDSMDIVGGYKVYLDGQLLGAYPMNGVHGNFIPPQRPCVGAAYDMSDNTWHYLSGMIDEVRIYNEVLSPSEIESLVCFGWNPADLFADCKVDINDLELFVAAWLSHGTGLPADFDGNQTVDIRDFAAFAAAWLEN
jgi:hypothetical protein